MAKMSWAYVAGFFDGEGSMYASSQVRPHYSQGGLSWQLTITQAYEPVLKEIQDFLQEQGIKSAVRKHDYLTRFTRNKMVYSLCLLGGRGGIKAFLTGCFPYLRVKKACAQDLLRIFEMFPPLNGKTRKRRFLSPEQLSKFQKGREAWLASGGREKTSQRMTMLWAERKSQAVN